MSVIAVAMSLLPADGAGEYEGEEEYDVKKRKVGEGESPARKAVGDPAGLKQQEQAKQADYFPLAGSILSPPKSKHHLFFAALALLDPVTSA